MSQKKVNEKVNENEITKLCSSLPVLKKIWGLAELIFPETEKSTQLESKNIFPDVADYINRASALKPVFILSVLLLDTYSVLRFQKSFRNINESKKNILLKSWAETFGVSYLLRALLFPFKAVYINRKEVLQASGCTNKIDVAKNIEPERWLSQYIDSTDCEEDQDLEADVVVIGTGAGGAAAAYKLASKGHAVVLIEEGEFFNRTDFNGNQQEIFSRMYRNTGLTFSTGNTSILIPHGKTVGGSTTINSGTCFRTPDSVLSSWRKDGLSELSPENLESYFVETEQMLRVTKAEDKYVGKIGEIVKKGAGKLGFTQAENLPRNAPDCDGQGTCTLGCPTDAKRSTNVSFIPAALKEGAFLFSSFKVEKLVKSGKTIIGVEAKSANPVNGRYLKLKVKASKVIVAAGALHTPQFLKANGIHNKNIGEHLSIHPSQAVSAYFKDIDFKNQTTIPQGVGINDLHGEGIMLEGGTFPLFAYGITLQSWGKEYVEQIQHYNNTAFFGAMLKDESRGTVKWDLPGAYPVIKYNMKKKDFKKYLKSLEVIVKIFLEAGAEEVYIFNHHTLPVIRSHKDLEKFLKQKLKPNDFTMAAWHPLGTAKMAKNADVGVCDVNAKVFNYEGLYIMDGSTVPSSLGVNPQITIMSLALRAADILAKEI